MKLSRFPDFTFMNKKQNKRNTFFSRLAKRKNYFSCHYFGNEYDWRVKESVMNFAHE